MLHGNETHKAGLKMIVDKNAVNRVNTWFRTIFRVFKNETFTTTKQGLKMNAEIENQTDNQEQPSENLGIPTISNMLDLLSLYAVENMPIHAANWLKSGIAEMTMLETQNLQAVVSGVAGLVGADEKAGNFRGKEEVSSLLYSIAHQLDVINGFNRLYRELEYRVAFPNNTTQ